MPPRVAARAPNTSCPGCPRFTGPEAKATEADNPVRMSGTEFLSVVAIGPIPMSENWKRAL